MGRTVADPRRTLRLGRRHHLRPSLGSPAELSPPAGCQGGRRGGRRPLPVWPRAFQGREPPSDRHGGRPGTALPPDPLRPARRALRFILRRGRLAGHPGVGTGGASRTRASLSTVSPAFVAASWRRRSAAANTREPSAVVLSRSWRSCAEAGGGAHGPAGFTPGLRSGPRPGRSRHPRSPAGCGWRSPSRRGVGGFAPGAGRRRGGRAAPPARRPARRVP